MTDDSRQEVERVNYLHDAIIELILTCPGIHHYEIAQKVGRTAAWISRVIATDRFQARLALRRAEICDPEVRENFQSRVEATSLRYLDVLDEKGDRPAAQIPDGFALGAFTATTKAAGYGAKPTVQITNNTFEAHLQAHAAQLRALLRRTKAEARKAEAIDAEFTPAQPTVPQPAAQGAPPVRTTESQPTPKSEPPKKGLLNRLGDEQFKAIKRREEW